MPPDNLDGYGKEQQRAQQEQADHRLCGQSGDQSQRAGTAEQGGAERPVFVQGDGPLQADDRSEESAHHQRPMDQCQLAIGHVHRQIEAQPLQSGGHPGQQGCRGGGEQEGTPRIGGHQDHPSWRRAAGLMRAASHSGDGAVSTETGRSGKA